MTIGIIQQVGNTVDNVPTAGAKHIPHSATLPSAPTSGNTLILVGISALEQDAPLALPSGWTSRASYASEFGIGAPAMLVASKIAGSGESATVTITDVAVRDSSGARRSNLHVFEVNGVWGGITSIYGDGFGRTPGYGVVHSFPAITPPSGAEVLLFGNIVNENAYGINSGPGAGYTDILNTLSNDGASDWLHTFYQHIAGASGGSYGGDTITYAANCTATAVQFWVGAPTSGVTTSYGTIIA